MKSLTGSLVVDEIDEYAVTAEVSIDRSKGKVQLSPMFEVRRVGVKNVQLTGFVSYLTPFKSADIDLSLSGLTMLPMTFKSKFD